MYVYLHLLISTPFDLYRISRQDFVCAQIPLISRQCICIYYTQLDVDIIIIIK